jgi:hypothetical protein
LYGSIELLDSFELTIPEDYIHYTQLDGFYTNNRRKFTDYDKNIIDTNFSNVSHQLKRGKTYTIDIFKKLEGSNINAEDFLVFLSTFVDNPVLTGAQG